MTDTTNLKQDLQTSIQLKLDKAISLNRDGYDDFSHLTSELAWYLADIYQKLDKIIAILELMSK